MAQEILYESERIVISYDHDEGWLFADWIGQQEIADIKNGGAKMVECFKAAGTDRVLNDNTHITGSWAGAAAWAGTNWLPRMVEAGLKHFAWVYSSTVISRLSVKSGLYAGGEHADIIRVFTDIEEAKVWLRSVG